MNSDIIIYGESDDVVQIDGALPTCDEYDTAGSGKAAFVVHCTGDAAVRVRLNFEGVWAITLSQLDEDVPMPTIHVVSDGYTAKAMIPEAMTIVREGVPA